ncbi:hypothetical protein HLG76_14170 [Salinivibrio sp. EAGSL]|uniref:hypothetical protein n=1 Tax=Salinivibrio sp. EAGSL TaxID=2738468 RepID=UPI001589F673|nr:hypothetical protein [Salinivibrio sp. EAGSL]NUY57665.1 hypothetical protein [Salinivibrio sp. EAGSL]
MEKLISLHKHWLNADSVKEVIATEIGDDHGLPEGLADFAELHSSFARLSVLYGLIYVVIEGYKELKCTNPKVDELLSQEHFVDALRLFRNSTFHFQKDPIPEKAMKFLELPESESWIRALHLAFKKFFEAELPIKEMMDKLNA